MNLIALFFLFMYIGFSTIGGGLVSITLMQQELLSRSLISPEKFIEMIAVSESTPGPIGINMATYIGYELYGVWGSIVLTAGMVLPSLIIITLIAHFSASIQRIQSVRYSMYGLRAAASGMIAAAAWNVLTLAVFTLPAFKHSYKWHDLCNWKALSLLFLFLIAQNRIKKLHPLFLIIVGAFAGIIFFN